MNRDIVLKFYLQVRFQRSISIYILRVALRPKRSHSTRIEIWSLLVVDGVVIEPDAVLFVPQNVLNGFLDGVQLFFHGPRLFSHLELVVKLFENPRVAAHVRIQVHRDDVASFRVGDVAHVRVERADEPDDD